MCVGACLGRLPPLPPTTLLLGFKVLHLSLPAPSLQKTEVIDRSHQGDSELDSSSGTAGGNTGCFLRLSCSSEALHLLEQSRESSCFLLYEPVVLSPKSEPRAGLRPCHRNILFLCLDPCSRPIPKRRGSGKTEGESYKTNK